MLPQIQMRHVRRALAARGWTRASLASSLAPRPRAPGRLSLNRLCRPDAWQDPVWRTVNRAIGLPQQEGWYHRKAFEWTQCVYGLERLAALSESALVVGVGSGHELVLYYMANVVSRMVATDLYKGEFVGSLAMEADPEFLRNPDAFAPFAYRKDHLVALPADGCVLPFRPNTFDAAISLSSIEHFGGHDRAAAAMREIGRVLKPGGIACIATELILAGGEHEEYFTRDELDAYVVRPSGLVPVEPLDETLPPQEHFADPVLLPEQVSKNPHIVISQDGWLWTSVVLFLRKPQLRELVWPAARRLVRHGISTDPEVPA